jgi:hypothetical protein
MWHKRLGVSDHDFSRLAWIFMVEISSRYFDAVYPD